MGSGACCPTAIPHPRITASHVAEVFIAVCSIAHNPSSPRASPEDDRTRSQPGICLGQPSHSQSPCSRGSQPARDVSSEIPFRNLKHAQALGAVHIDDLFAILENSGDLLIWERLPQIVQ